MKLVRVTSFALLWGFFASSTVSMQSPFIFIDYIQVINIAVTRSRSPTPLPASKYHHTKIPYGSWKPGWKERIIIAMPNPKAEALFPQCSNSKSSDLQQQMPYVFFRRRGQLHQCPDMPQFVTSGRNLTMPMLSLMQCYAHSVWCAQQFTDLVITAIRAVFYL